MPQSETNALGLYVSVPFCRSKCTYCNFASGVYPASEHARYVERLISDIESAPAWAHSKGLSLPKQADTIYFGGGTPVLLEPEHFSLIFAAIRNSFEVVADAEITIEAAPGQISDAVLDAMVVAGVNRLSLGAQSFIDREAQQSGRLHSRTIVLEDLRRLRAAGLTNLNLDLLAGLAGQTMASWRESLAVLLDTGVPHASVYMLEIDDESRLGRELIAGGVRYGAELVPSDDTIAAMYEEAIEAFADAGLAQYEISNCARNGAESKHNMRYWQRRPYLGVGLDASSMLHAEDGMVLRTTTTSDLSEYLSGEATHAESAWLGPAQQLEEAWFLGLRRNIGVDIASLRTEFGGEAIQPSLQVAERLAGEGLLHVEHNVKGQPGTARLTARGRLLSNDVFAEFLGLAMPAEAAVASR